MIPKVMEILSQRFKKIIPVYFWGNREGSILAKRNLDGELFRIVAIYARRPKTIKNNNSSIECKINQELIQKSQMLHVHNIPSFAGMPLINTLLHFNEDAKFLWFNINNLETETIIKFPIKSDDVHSFSSAINCHELMNIINEDTRPIAWVDTVPLITEINRLFDRGPNLRYKPVYLLLPESITG